jgi:hypothetical protein
MEIDMTISVAVEEWKNQPNAWTVEAIGEDGEIYQAIFLGPEAKERAYEYARLRYDFKPQLPRR